MIQVEVKRELIDLQPRARSVPRKEKLGLPEVPLRETSGRIFRRREPAREIDLPEIRRGLVGADGAARDEDPTAAAEAGDPDGRTGKVDLVPQASFPEIPEEQVPEDLVA